MLDFPDNLKNMLHPARKYGVIDQGKYKKGQVNESGKTGNVRKVH